MSIAGVLVHEGVEGCHETVLAVIVGEVVAPQVVDEDIALFVDNVADLPTLVEAGRHVEDLSGSVRDYFSSGGALLGADSHVVVALDPESEEPSPFHHLVVGGLVFRVSLGVADVLPDITAAQPDY